MDKLASHNGGACRLLYFKYVLPAGPIATSNYETVTLFITRSMQGMFGASVSELYLLIKLLINIERTDLCVITKTEINMHTQEL